MPRPRRQERGKSRSRKGRAPGQPSCRSPPAVPGGRGQARGSALHWRGSWTSEGKAQQKGPLLAQDVGWPSREFGPCRLGKSWVIPGVGGLCKPFPSSRTTPLPFISPRGAEQLWSRPWGFFWKQGWAPPPAAGATHAVPPGSLFPCVRRRGRSGPQLGLQAGRPVRPQAPGVCFAPWLWCEDRAGRP